MSHSPDSSLFPRLLAELEFPVTKDELLRRAEEQRAPKSIRDAISRLEFTEFASRNELTGAIEKLVNPSGS